MAFRRATGQVRAGCTHPEPLPWYRERYTGLVSIQTPVLWQGCGLMGNPSFGGMQGWQTVVVKDRNAPYFKYHFIHL